MFITPPLYVCIGTPRCPLNNSVEGRAAHQTCRLNADRQMTDGNSPMVGGRPPGGEGGVGQDIIWSRSPSPPLEGAGGKVGVAPPAMWPVVVATVA